MFSSLVAMIALAPSVAVHVDGEGFLRFVRDGRTVYAKEASLTVLDGKLASVDGPLVNPRVQVPAGVGALRVDLEGRIFGDEKEIGRLVLAVFPDDVRLVVEKGFLVSSYRPTLFEPGSETAGVVRTGKLGTATVKIVAPATTAGSVEVQLREVAVVEATAFTLGDIATIVADDATRNRLATLEVSSTPALGVPYRMTAEMVRQRLLRFGKDAEKYKFSGAAQVTVTRRGQEVTAAMFGEAATRLAKERLGQEVALATENTGASVVAPVGKLELTAEEVVVNGTRVSVRVAILVDGVRFNSRTVTLTKDDPTSKMRIGQTVKLLVRSGSATVETSGRVRSINLATGDIAVTAVTGAELIGRAVATDTVEVKL